MIETQTNLGNKLKISLTIITGTLGDGLLKFSTYVEKLQDQYTFFYFMNNLD